MCRCVCGMFLFGQIIQKYGFIDMKYIKFKIVLQTNNLNIVFFIEIERFILILNIIFLS